MKEYWLVQIRKKRDDSTRYMISTFYYTIYLGRFDTERRANYAMEDFINAIKRGKVKDSDNILKIEVIKGDGFQPAGLGISISHDINYNKLIIY